MAPNPSDVRCSLAEDLGKMDDIAAIAEAVGKGKRILFLRADVRSLTGAELKCFEPYPEARRPPLGRPHPRS